MQRQQDVIQAKDDQIISSLTQVKGERPPNSTTEKTAGRKGGG